MKVLFLDFDGVLNSHEWWRRQPLRSRDDRTNQLDPAAVGLVNQIVARTGCGIVISSTWRLFSDHKATESLRAAGFVGNVLGVTPDGAFMKGAIYGAVVRGHEIQKWIDTNAAVTGPLEAFAILDDDSDMAHLAPYLVKTSHTYGLTQADADRIVVMLGGTPPRILEGR